MTDSPAPTSPRASARIVRFLPLGVLALTLFAAYWVWTGSYRAAQREIDGYFDFRLRDADERITQRLRAYEVVLQGTRGLFNASGEVQRGEFKSYVASLMLEKRFPGIQGVGFAEQILPEKKDEHVTKIRAEGFPEYEIRPPGARDLYGVIIYLEPFRDRNLRAFGFDMYHEPVRRAALMRARDEGVTAVSGKVTLVQETNVNRQAGFLMYVPVYRTPVAPPTVEERRAAFKGWAYAPFRMNDFLDGVLGEQAGDLDLEIFDGDDARVATMMYDSQGSGDPAAETAPLHARRHIEFGGHGWLLVAGSRSDLLGHSAVQRARPVGLAGLAASLLLTLLTWVLATSRERAIAIADARGEELRKLAQVQATILANANVGIIFVRERIVVWANRRMEEMLSQEPDALIAKTTRAYYADEERYAKVGAEGYATLAAGGVYEVELPLIRGDGTQVWVHAYGKAVDANDLGAGSIWAYDDVTARRAADEELAARRRELEEMIQSLEQRIARSVEEIREKDRILIVQGRQAAMGEMIGNIAHQWRQPLNALGLVIANIVDAHRAGELDTETLRPLAADAKRLIQKMSTTITDFRTFFRPDKEQRAFSSIEQVNAAIDLVRAAFESQHITCTLDAPEDVHVWGVANEYSQVLLNVLVNAKEAIGATAAKSGVIEIRLTRESDMGVATIRDSGGGIPKDLLDRIFEPYFSTKPSGTGIGLHMCKTIIEKNMGGKITARNVDGGAEITIRVPCAKPV